MPPLAPPDGPTLTGANLKSGILAELIQLADRLGVDSRLWFEGMRLDNTRFDDEPPVYLSYRQACQIIRRALASLPGQGHGLTVGRAQGVGRFGLLGLAMMTAEDFGEALRLAMQFAAISGALMELEIDTQALDHGDRGVAMVARMGTPEPDLEPFLCEELFASSLMLCRGLLGAQFTPALVELSYPAPAYADEYRRLFECELRFGTGRNRVVFDEHWLGRPMPAHNPSTARLIRELCRQQMPAARPSGEIAATVERLVRLQLADGPRLVDIGAELHLNERTLRRHLREAGTSFQAIHDRVRLEAAEALLATPGPSIAEIGAAIGFHDPREFRRAFKRWTGRAPRQARTLAQ